MTVRKGGACFDLRSTCTHTLTLISPFVIVTFSKRFCFVSFETAWVAGRNPVIVTAGWRLLFAGMACVGGICCKDLADRDDFHIFESSWE